MNHPDQTFSLAKPPGVVAFAADVLLLICTISLAFSWAPITFGLMSLFQGLNLLLWRQRPHLHPKLRMALETSPWLALLLMVLTFASSIAVGIGASLILGLLLLSILRARAPEARFYQDHVEIANSVMTSSYKYSEIVSASPYKSSAQVNLATGGKRYISVSDDEAATRAVVSALVERIAQRSPDQSL